MWIGLDDTDSPQRGCTTWVITELIRELDPGIDLVGWPRLVRLNPNIPYKTRGNGALAVHLGHGRGDSFLCGNIGGTPVRGYWRGTPLTRSERERTWEIALRVLQRESAWESPRTDPALVASPRKLPPALYWRAVREWVEVSTVREILGEVSGALFVAYRSGQGLVGSAAAIAWPARRRTWEILAYRDPDRWSDPQRSVEAASVRKLSETFPETFHSYDPRTRRVLVTPHTRCPILVGIRARLPDRLPDALRSLRTERVVRWMVFQSNQGTGDHVQPGSAGFATPGTSPLVRGFVQAPARNLRGGHVLFPVQDRTGVLSCVAFEPTKTLPSVARQLLPGDEVEVWGSLPAETPRSPILKLEGLRVLRARPVRKPGGNPMCPSCRTIRTHSRGQGKGFRCPRCGQGLPPEARGGPLRPRRHLEGTYLPTPSARRHLSPPTGVPFRRAD